LQRFAPTWVMCCDVDEYLVLENHKTIDEFLAENESADAIAFNWKHFGSNGKLEKEEGMTIERFIMRSPPEYNRDQMVKSIFKYSDKIQSFGPHRPRFIDDYVPSYSYPDKSEVPQSFWKEGKNLSKIQGSKIDHSVASVHHYSIRSKQEFQQRIVRGKGSTWGDYNDAHFKKKNVNHAEDRSALKCIDDVRERLKFLTDICEGRS